MGCWNVSSAATSKRPIAERGVTGEVLLEQLERRLDNVIHRASFANSRDQARQLIRHSHVLVNKRKVAIPSYLIEEGDVVEFREKSKKLLPVQEAIQRGEQRGFPPWLEVEPEQVRATVRALPRREDQVFPVREQLVVEFYSK